MSITRRPAVFLFSLAVSGCAAILGLDSGNPTADDGGTDAPDDEQAEASESSDAALTDASTVADTSTTCAPGTADCNGNPADGCETNLNDPMHCGSCTKMCPPVSICMAESCCLPKHGACSSGSDCCSGNCGGGSSCK